jgi:ATP-binding region, ATPase-like protein
VEMKKYIDFPEKITNGFETIQFLNRLLDDKEKDMYYKLGNITFFEASMVPFFHSLNMQLFQTHEKIFYNKINKEIEVFFLRNKYASKFNSKYMNIKLEDIYKTYIEFVEIKKDDESGFYIIEKNIKDKKLMDFNDELQNFFISLVGELTNNSHEHGETEKAYFCGQYYPKISKLSFAISNLGKTINEKVKTKRPNLSNKKCLDWIFQEGTTTRKDGTNGGQGLYELKNVVKKLKGNITVISGYDYYRIEKNGKIDYNRLENKYKGTTFIIDIFYNRGGL